LHCDGVCLWPQPVRVRFVTLLLQMRYTTVVTGEADHLAQRSTASAL
jgi:hypothetical protein